MLGRSMPEKYSLQSVDIPGLAGRLETVHGWSRFEATAVTKQTLLHKQVGDRATQLQSSLAL
jgi:hypothetical protein